jgi:tartrate-resistant acid phosphatase type 5
MRTSLASSLVWFVATGALIAGGPMGCADDEVAATSSAATTGSLTGAGGADEGSGGDDAGSTRASSGPGGTSGTTAGAGAGSSTSSSATGTTTSGGSGGGGGEGGGGPGPTGTLRFVALGDGGEGNDTQYAVAATVGNLCASRGGCDFALYLGDNIYDSGADEVRSDLFDERFEAPYAGLDFRFWVVLGNHDYGGNGAGYEEYKANVQVDYTSMSSKWTMPARHYQFGVPADAGPADAPTVDLYGLDTNWVMYNGDEDQQDWLDGAIAASSASWRIAFGHHPYISNGQHGNAGEYEGIPFIPIVSGANVRDFMEDSICGKVDIYISGHDHNRQWLEPTCGTEFVVSGTAAKTTDLVGRDTPTFFETDEDGGFMLVEITGNTLVGEMYDQQGTLEFSRTITKP